MNKRKKFMLLILGISFIMLSFFIVIFGFIYDPSEEQYESLKLTDDDIDQKPIAFSPDGSKILFIQGAVDLTYNANTTEIWMMNSDGSRKEFISECYWHPYDLQFSPDGSKILYGDANEMIGGGLYDIWIIDLETRIKSELTNDTSYNIDPVFTPDGKKILFVSGGIWIMDLDGSNQISISNHGRYPSVKPDGKKVSYLHNDEIHLMDLDGSNTVQLTNTSIEKSRPKFSPSGDHISFYSSGKWILNVSTLEIEPLMYEERNFSQFSFSRDQSTIVFTSQPEKGFNKPVDIYVANFDRTRINRLTNGGTNWNPVFNHDGTKILFRNRNEFGDDFEIFIISDSSGKWDL